MSTPTANNHSWYSTKNDGLNQRGVSPSPQLYNRTVQHHSNFHSNAYTWQQQQQVPPPPPTPQQQYSWYNPNQHLKPSGSVTPQMNSSSNTGDVWQWDTNTAYQQQQHHHQQLQQQQQQQQHHYGQYQQQATQPYPSEYRNTSSTNSDPWNWGWDESVNSANTEQQNNNAAVDPTWNWSVEGSGNYQENNVANANYAYGSVQQTPYSVAKTELSSNVPTYGQESQSHGTVYPNSSFASVTESFQSSQPGNLSLYGHNHQSQSSQPIANESAERYNPRNRIDEMTSNATPMLDQSSQYLNVFHENKQSTTSMVPIIKEEHYDQGYQDNAPTQQVIANETSNKETLNRLPSVGVGTGIVTKTEIVLESKSEEDANVPQKQEDTNQSDKRRTEYPDSHPLVMEDNGKLNNVSGLPSQWSTESLPSQGSDDISQTLEGSSRSEGASSLSAVSHSPSIIEPAPHLDTAEQHKQEYAHDAKNKQQGQGLHNTENYVYMQENIIENQDAQASSAYRYNTSIPQPNLFVKKDLYSNTQVETSAPLESITSGVKSMVLTSNESSASPDVENEEIVSPEGEANPENMLQVGSNVAAPPRSMPVAQGQNKNPYAKPKGPLTHKYRSNSPIGEGASAIDRRNYNSSRPEPENIGKMSQFSSLPEVMSQTINNLMQTPYSVGSKLGETVPGYSSKNKKSVTPPITEEAVNLETVPDNKERPDNVDLQQLSKHERKSSPPSITGPRLHTVPVGQDANRTVSQWNQPSSYSASPENQEVAPRCGPDRNQYLETGQLMEDESHNLNTSLTSEGFLPPPGLHRMVPGQLTEQESVVNNFMPENNMTNNFGEDISTPPPGLRRLVPGQFTEHENIPSQEADESVISENIGDDALFQRMVPGQLTEEGGIGNFVSEDASDGAAPANDVPPPGLRRMIPGESSSPESQGNAAALLAQTGTPLGTFQPINALPLEPRVVTGVAQDEIDGVGSVATLQITSSPMSSGSRVKSEPESPVPEPNTNSNSLPQPPSERSETIGSDSVETYPPPASDNAIRDSSSRRDNVTKERDRRHRDEQDGKDLDAAHQRRQTDVGSYYPHRDKDRGESPEGNRYRDRDERDWKSYDARHDRDRDDSPGGDRYRDGRDRRHYDSRNDYRRSRHKPSYDRHEDDADTEDYYSDHDRDKSSYGESYDRYRPRSDRERHREVYDKSRRKPDMRGSGRERDRDLGRDRDHILERDRDKDRNRDRDRNHDRDRLREREKDRRRHDYYPERPDYRRGDGYYGRYEDDPYYREHSRPSSRSGSHAEYDDYWRRDYHAYGAYYYNYYENLRRTNPAAYAEWYAKVYLAQQQNYNQGSVSEDRGSVHSGRSSANDERFHRPGHSQAIRYLNTSLTGSYNGRAPEQNDSFLAEEATTATTPQRLTPAKFSTAHVKGVFTASGQFLKVLPHYPLDGQSAMVEIHDVGGLPDGFDNRKELQDFPGPLVRGVTHKNSIITFCTRKIKKAEHDLELYDRESVILLWRLLVLLLRQNGTVVGTDIAELLLSNSSHPEAATSSSTISIRPSPATSQHDVHQDDGSLTQPPPTKTEEEITNEFREYLLYGNTKEALEWAMKHGLWGHALFLASKMDQRTYANVMMRFANGLPMNDPLQTLYQLMSGRQPAAVTCCADEKWGDWKPHLAMILSNTSQRPELEHKAITTLGDTLAARGCLHAAHFCYLMAQLEFGSYTQKSSKIVLLGSSHAKSFYEFASNEAIQMTEIYIYSCQLADPEFNLPQFQAYKFLYALRLAEQGMSAEAIHYIEVIAGTILQRPTSYNVHFIKEVYELGDRLKYYDPVYTNIESEELESADPAWLVGLRNVIDNYSMGLIQQEVPSYGSLSNLSTSEADPSQHGISGIGQNYQDPMQIGGQWQQDQVNYYQNQQAYWQQQPQQQIQQGQSQGIEGANEGYQTEAFDDPNKQATDPYWQNSHWMQETAYTETMQQNQDESIQTVTKDVASNQQWQEEQQQHQQEQQQQQQQAAFNYWDMSPSQGEDTPRVTLPGTATESVSQHRPPSPSVPEKKLPAKQKTKEETTKPSQQTNSWWIGGIWNKISLRPKNQMKLPDDKNPSIVWDPDKKRWTNLDEDGDDATSSLPPPPKASELPSSKAATQQSAPTESSSSNAPPSASNMYKLGGPVKGRKPKYVDVLSGSKATNQSIPAPDLFPPVSTQQTSVNYFVPAPVESNENAPTDFLSGGGEVTSNAHESQTADNSQGMAAMEPQPTYGAPMMFDPTSFSQQANVAKSSGTLGRKRYPNN